MISTRQAVWISLATALGLALFTVAAEAVIRFAAPARLLAMTIPAALVPLFLGYLVWRGRLADALGHRGTVLSMAGTWSGRRQVSRFVLLVASTVFLVLALARPQWGEQTREVRRQGIDVVFAFDISRSMLATDVAPNRLLAAKAEMRRLLTRLQGDRVGLVVYAGVAFVQSPLTSDYGAIRLYLDRIDPEHLSVQGTAIGRSIHEATRLLVGGQNSETFERATSQIIIVFSDGEDHETDPIAAATEAFAQGIHVYTVGVGTPEGGRIPLHDRDGSLRSFMTDSSGQVVVTRLEEEQLVEIARVGGGEYVALTQEGSAAAALESAIANYDQAALSSALRLEYEDRFPFFLGLSFLLLLGATLLPERRRDARLIAGALALAMLPVAGCGDALMRPDPRVERAHAHAESGNFSEALAELDRVPEPSRSLPEFHYSRGHVYEGDERYRDAQEAYVRALATNDTAAQVSALFALGNALLHQDEFALAIERYRRALVLDSTHEGARRNLEIALLRLFPPCSELDDDFEDNDDAASAATLPAVVYEGPYLPPGVERVEGMEESVPSLVACPGDADWFAIPVVGGATLDVDVTFTRLRADTGREAPPEQIAPQAVRVTMLDVDAVSTLAIDLGEDGDDGPLVPAGLIRRALRDVPIAANVDANGLVWLKIEVDPPLEYRYQVSITLTPPCWALEDGFEPNDGREHATTLPPGRHAARICATNNDWYTSALELGDNLFVDVTPVTKDDGTPGTIDARWYVGDEAAPRDEARVTDSLAPFAVRDAKAPTAGTLQIASAEGTEGGYQVDVFHFPPCPSGNDRFEPNDSPDQAHVIDLQSDPPPLRHLRLCDEDQDWFVLPLPEVPEEDREDQPRRLFSAVAEVDSAERDIVLAVYDASSGAQLARSTPFAAAPPVGLEGVTAAMGAIAFTELDWESEAVVVVVAGADPGFYHLSFPFTEAEQQQQQERQEQEEEQSDEQSDEQTDGDGADPDPEQDSGEESAPEPTDPEDDAESGEEEDDSPEDAQTPSEEEARELLQRLLDTIEPEDVNLPLRQAVEAAPRTRMQNEW